MVGNMKSLWRDTAKMPRFESLNRDIKTDVLVIGGGIAGLLCARMLSDAGVDCVVAEANRICSGVTEGTTAKITVGHGLIYHKILRRRGAEAARLYMEANLAALEKYREISAKTDCGFETQDAVIYSVNDRTKLEDELSALDEIGYPGDFVPPEKLPVPACGGVRIGDQAQFDPLRFLASAAAGLKIYENTLVRALDGTVGITESGRISADAVIVATHFPFINSRGLYFLKMYQSRSYVIAVQSDAEVDGMYADEADGGISLRRAGDFLLIGGGGHRTGGETSGWSTAEEFAARAFPGCPIKYRWAAQDCITPDDVPYAGLYSKNTPGIYVITGFNKWGMTSSMATAEIITDMICKKQNPYASVFDPGRSTPFLPVAANGLSTVSNLLTPTAPRCPHLGCALKKNKSEHTWDCPCHGSRFTESGKLINGPAMKNLKAIPHKSRQEP